MSAHTDGPWRVAADGSIGTVETVSGTTIAQAMQVKPLSHDMKQVERRANARLIAAAPCLLAALQDMVRMYEDVQPPGGYQGVYEIAQAAIAKATGETK